MDCWVDQGSDVGGWLVNTRQCGLANRQYGSLVNTDGRQRIQMREFRCADGRYGREYGTNGSTGRPLR
jgi:hypothetical protein